MYPNTTAIPTEALAHVTGRHPTSSAAVTTAARAALDFRPLDEPHGCETVVVANGQVAKAAPEAVTGASSGPAFEPEATSSIAAPSSRRLSSTNTPLLVGAFGTPLPNSLLATSYMI